MCKLINMADAEEKVQYANVDKFHLVKIKVLGHQAPVMHHNLW